MKLPYRTVVSLNIPPDDMCDWIAQQEQRRTDDAALRRDEIASELLAISARLAVEVCGRSLDEESELAPYAKRIWTCVEYHWRRMAKEGNIGFNDVVGRIEDGRLSYGKFRANILHEIVLAQAMQQSENEAARIFNMEYIPGVLNVANRIGGSRAIESFENLAADLTLPRGDRPPKIATFNGRTTMTSWLRSVVTNDWISRLRKMKHEEPDRGIEPCDSRDPTSSIDQTHCEQMLEPIFVEAVQGVDSDDRLLLKMLILDGVQQSNLAKSLGVNNGTLTRRRQRAASNILEGFRRIVSRRKSDKNVTECLHLVLAGDDANLRRRLADVLAQGVTDTDLTE